jgi:hypothetical protein
LTTFNCRLLDAAAMLGRTSGGALKALGVEVDGLVVGLMADVPDVESADDRRRAEFLLR